jgi:hypothetical protein
MTEFLAAHPRLEPVLYMIALIVLPLLLMEYWAWRLRRLSGKIASAAEDLRKLLANFSDENTRGGDEGAR